MFAFSADDTFSGFGKICDMPKPVRLRTKPRAIPEEKKFDPSRPPEVKAHYISEWMEYREVTVADMVAALELSTPSQVYRWLGGQRPQDETFIKIAGILRADPPEALLRHPLDEWMTRFLRGRSDAEAKAIIELLERAYPTKRA